MELLAKAVGLAGEWPAGARLKWPEVTARVAAQPHEVKIQVVYEPRKDPYSLPEPPPLPYTIQPPMKLTRIEAPRPAVIIEQTSVAESSDGEEPQ